MIREAELKDQAAVQLLYQALCPDAPVQEQGLAAPGKWGL